MAISFLRILFVFFFCFASLFSYGAESNLDLEKENFWSSPDLRTEMDKAFRYNREGPNYIGYLQIERDRQIDQSTYIYIKFALDEFKKKHVSFIVLDLNTPGGEVIYALKIAALLQEMDLKYHIPVIAFIDNWAVSAGALLAYSCRFIGIVPSSIMGAAEPVLASSSGEMKAASEKVNSALRAEFTNAASLFHRNPLIAKAMVDKDIILVFREGQIKELSKPEEMVPTDTIISGKGKLLTLNAKELAAYKVADFMIPYINLPAVTDKEREAGLWPASKSLVFQQPILKKIPGAILISYKNWKINFFSVLTHPVVSSLLLIGLMLGFYVEMSTPGFGVPGFIALACLVLIVLSSFAVYAISWIEVIFIVLGIALLLIEIFLIPGFGFTGILGIVICIIGLFALMLPSFENFNFFDPDSFSLIAGSLLHRLAWLAGGLIAAVIIIAFLARFVSKKLLVVSKLVLRGEEEGSQGYISTPPSSKLPCKGMKGTAFTPLRTAGKVMIDEELYDAVSDGRFIEQGEKVEIIDVRGGHLVVKRIE
ncbi:MAG: NfeD family protein [Simkaniaceae bacterium]